MSRNTPTDAAPHDSSASPAEIFSRRAGGKPGASPNQRAAGISGRPYVRGKFIWADDEKLYVRGVTYGTFRPNDQGEEFSDPARVEADLEQIAAVGCNAVRTYTPPPVWMLDAAQRHGLRVMVGLPWEQHIDFLADSSVAKRIEANVREWVRARKAHPAVLCFAIGNEIPAPIVRWLGAGPVEAFLRRLYHAVKEEDPGALVTYVNYPSTEYLQAACDIICFNVYLESQQILDAYLGRLQNIAGDRPLVMAEIGLDSRRNGEGAQAKVLEWQVRTAFSAGCAGAFVFAWTDEWHRGGHDIDDWDFGLTDRDRRPKPALAAVREAFVDIPFPWITPWPMFSIVICSYNGARTIGETLAALTRLHYRNFETIVVDDGSSDGTAEIALGFDVRVITTPNRGLSSARNTGMEAGRGEVIVYLDDDAYPDPHWLSYLAAMFLHSDHVAIGGPNLPPPGAGVVPDAVAASPGGPIHVLYSDRDAEHIPGCNMAVRKTALEAIGGFDPRFRAAGDDVDVCWRLLDKGWTIGFCPPAMVWHHRRGTVSGYWKQQRGYGRAEAMLQKKWPGRYNSAGHVTWKGQLYGGGMPRRLVTGRGRIHFGQWGTGLFQSLYEPSPGMLRSLPLMPEWYLLIASLSVLTALGGLWPPLLWSGVGLVIASGLLIADAMFAAGDAHLLSTLPGGERRKRRLLTFFLHLLQPLARLMGRLSEGLAPWRRHGRDAMRLAWPETILTWSETWQSAEDRLASLESLIGQTGTLVSRGGACDRWDLQASGGPLGGVRLLMAIEEHGAGKQLARFRVWPTVSPFGAGIVLFLAGLAVVAAFGGSVVTAALIGAGALWTAVKMVRDCSFAHGAVHRSVKVSGGGSPITG